MVRLFFFFRVLTHTHKHSTSTSVQLWKLRPSHKNIKKNTQNKKFKCVDNVTSHKVLLVISRGRNKSRLLWIYHIRLIGWKNYWGGCIFSSKFDEAVLNFLAGPTIWCVPMHVQLSTKFFEILLMNKLWIWSHIFAVELTKSVQLKCAPQFVCSFTQFDLQLDLIEHWSLLLFCISDTIQFTRHRCTRACPSPYLPTLSSSRYVGIRCICCICLIRIFWSNE